MNDTNIIYEGFFISGHMAGSLDGRFGGFTEKGNVIYDTGRIKG